MRNEYIKTDKSNTMFEDQLKSMIKETSSTNSEKLIMDIIQMVLEKKKSDHGLFEIMQLLGVDGLCKLVHLFNGRTVTFPKVTDFKDSIESGLIYYYRKVKGIENWDKLKELIGNPDISTVSFGLRTNNLDTWITKKVDEFLAELQDGETNE